MCIDKLVRSSKQQLTFKSIIGVWPHTTDPPPTNLLFLSLSLQKRQLVVYCDHLTIDWTVFRGRGGQHFKTVAWCLVVTQLTQSNKYQDIFKLK